MNKKIWIALGLSSLLFLGCSEQTKEEAKQVSNETIDKVAEVTQKTVDTTTQVAEKVKQDTQPVVDKVVDKSKEVVEKAKHDAQPVVETVIDKSKEVLESSKEVINNVTQSAVQMKEDVQQKIHTATAPKIDGKALYTKCVACHGANGEKKALNASKVIQGWEKEKVLNALKGYQNSTYGGAMKSIMLGQVKSFSDEELEALATYISTL